MKKKKKHTHTISSYSQCNPFTETQRKGAKLTGTNVRHIATQPMQPIEDGALAGRGRRTEQRADRLQEANDRRNQAEYRVWVIFGRPTAQLDEDQHNAGDGEQPGQHHEQAMPLRGCKAAGKKGKFEWRKMKFFGDKNGKICPWLAVSAPIRPAFIAFVALTANH